MWNSELCVIAQASVPHVNDVLSSGISSRIIERLGEDAADKISLILDVNQIMVEDYALCETVNWVLLPKQVFQM